MRTQGYFDVSAVGPYMDTKVGIPVRISKILRKSHKVHFGVLRQMRVRVQSPFTVSKYSSYTRKTSGMVTWSAAIKTVKFN